MMPATPAILVRIPLGRLGRPKEVAQATLMVMVMVMGNDYMTGQTLQLNRGISFT